MNTQNEPNLEEKSLEQKPATPEVVVVEPQKIEKPVNVVEEIEVTGAPVLDLEDEPAEPAVVFDFDQPEENEFDEFDVDGELPLYDFAENPVITLRDGTECVFKIPDLQSEQRADDLRQTTTITSPHKINGQNPTQDHTDFFKADQRYFLDNALELRNFAFNAGDEKKNFNAKEVVRTEKVGSREVQITYAHLVPMKHKRAFVGRLYGGKVEVEKPKGENEVVALNATRTVVIKQELGVEPTSDGRTTPPTHIIRFVFREPNAAESSAWTRCWNGYKLPIKGGGSKSVSSFKTEAVCQLFDKLVTSVTGAAFKGEALDVKRADHLAGIPAGVKRNHLAMAMNEFMGDVGND